MPSRILHTTRATVQIESGVSGGLFCKQHCNILIAGKRVANTQTSVQTPLKSPRHKSLTHADTASAIMIARTTVITTHFRVRFGSFRACQGLLQPSRKRLRTSADGCGQLRSQTQHSANTASPPNPQGETGPLPTPSGKKLLKSCIRA